MESVNTVMNDYKTGEMSIIILVIMLKKSLIQQ